MPAENKFPIWPAGLVATLVMFLAAAGLRVPDAPVLAPVAGRQPPLVLASEESELMREERAAHDPAPLFLSSKLGGGPVVPPGLLRPEARELSKEIPPKLKPVEAGPAALKFPGLAAVPASPTEGLALTEPPGAEPLALGLGDKKFPPLPARLGAVEAVDAGSGRVVWTKELAVAADTPREAWEPFELMGRIAPDGLVGGLTVTRGSVSNEVANDFRMRLAHDERVGERLPPGLYIFRIAP